MRNWMTRLREMPDFWELKRGIYYSEINLCFLILSCLIFQSSVERGIPSFAAAPSGPAIPFTFRKGPFNNFSLLILESVWQFLRGWLRADQPSLFDPKGIAAGQDHRSFKCFSAHEYFPAIHTIGTAPAYRCRSCKCTCRLPAFSAHRLT